MKTSSTDPLIYTYLIYLSHSSNPCKSKTKDDVAYLTDHVLPTAFLLWRRAIPLPTKGSVCRLPCHRCSERWLCRELAHSFSEWVSSSDFHQYARVNDPSKVLVWPYCYRPIDHGRFKSVVNILTNPLPQCVGALLIFTSRSLTQLMEINWSGVCRGTCGFRTFNGCWNFADVIAAVSEQASYLILQNCGCRFISHLFFQRDFSLYLFRPLIMDDRLDTT